MNNFCDDGDTAAEDGCSSTCTVECGYSCTGGTATTEDVCTSVCGDGIKTVTEACDDKNSASNDGCSSECTVETGCGYTCAGGSATDKDVCTSTCGDGFKAHSEACDDGNNDDDDGCSNACLIEAGYTCSTPDCALSVCGTVCGDGYACIRTFGLCLFM